MSSHLCLSVTFLDSQFHGKAEGNRLEWPPSPLRLFQALVASSTSRWKKPQWTDYVAPALRWLERQSPPSIVCPTGERSEGYVISVPNNAMDIVARAWSRGNLYGKNDASPATHRTMKEVRATKMHEDQAVSFLWDLPDPIPDEVKDYAELLSSAARHLYVLGWGYDFVAGHGAILHSEQVDNLVGERWNPVTVGGNATLRSPRVGTLDALVTRHQQFLSRLHSGGLTPTTPLSCFRETRYENASSPSARCFAAFHLRRPDNSQFQIYSPLRQSHIVAGMLRHVTQDAATLAGRDPDWISTFVAGHGDGANNQATGPNGYLRFSYLPAPTIESRRSQGNYSEVVGAIRRALIVGPPGEPCDETSWAQQALAGRELTPLPEDASTEEALLIPSPNHDTIIRRYVRSASVWSTVTPMLLPGVDDRKESKALRLIRRAIVQAGFSDELAQNAAIEFRRVGFWPGVEIAPRYACPQHIAHYPRYHVRITWRDPNGRPIEIPGPLCLGAGRFCGLGLFADFRMGGFST